MKLRYFVYLSETVTVCDKRFFMSSFNTFFKLFFFKYHFSSSCISSKGIDLAVKRIIFSLNDYAV